MTRVVTIASPHRGSYFANDVTQWLGRRLISLPKMAIEGPMELLALNPNLFRSDDLLLPKTSLDSLSPKCKVLPVMLAAPKPPWMRYHNIVGITKDKPLAENTDGVVPYPSAHLDDVLSEVVVQANHVTIHQQPKSVLEVRRILLEHLRELDEGYLNGRAAIPRTTLLPGATPVVR